MYQEDIWEKIALTCGSIMIVFMTFLTIVLLVLLFIKFCGWLF